MLRKTGRIIVLALMLVLIASSATAQDPRGDTYVTFIQPAGDCSSVSIQYVRYRSGDLIFVGSGFYGGQRFHDDVVFVSGEAHATIEWTFFYGNDRGTAPVNPYPMTPGVPLDLFLTVYTRNWEPLYEARARLKSCDSTSFKRVSSGPVYQLMQNHSFEVAGWNDGFVANQTKAAFWKGKNTTDDVRDCTAGSEFVGTCGLKFVANPGSVSKFKQTYTGIIGAKGDTVYLLGHATTSFGYQGGGKLIAKLTLTNGQVLTLKRNIAPGEATYGFPYDASAKLPAPIQSAIVTIKQKPGNGTVIFDAVTLSVFTNTNAQPRSLPLPEFASVMGSDQ